MSFTMERKKYSRYYELKSISLNLKKYQTECSSNGKGTIFGFFFVCRKMSKCRSPPLFNLFLKNQIERRKERWHNAQKEENIGIILIH